MRLKLVSLLLTIALSACTFQVDVIETPQPSETVVSDSSTSTPIPTPDISATPPPLETNTQLAAETSVISTFPPSDVLPIVFPANGTSQIVVGSVAAGSSQTYSLTAFDGQIMSVSIWAETPNAQNTFKLEIKGSNDTILCPVETYTCPFWRGVLPSTQEYFITVVPNVGGAFKMLIAINPPGQSNQYFDYADPRGRYTLSYSDEFAPMNSGNILPFKFAPEFALQYIDTKQYLGTNLSEAYFLIGSSDDSHSVSTCTEPANVGGPEAILGDVQVNGVTFTKSQGGGVAAGNIYEQTFYRTVHNGTCYEITYFLHSGNIANYAGNVREFDHDVLLQRFDQILSTFVLK